ncbi:MAG: hypothetical protein FJY56_19620 [Betaproteobacteria bacterium]|nr:hypothetical protein [Betaproteobacteria bacterium]
MSGALFWRKLAILHATRKSRELPFEPPRVIAAIRGFVEAPTISADGRALYYHQKTDSKYQIYRVTQP